MSGTREGGLKTVITTKQRYGDDFYKKIGHKGGSTLGLKKGFAANHDLAVSAGRKGGIVSRRSVKDDYNDQETLKNNQHKNWRKKFKLNDNKWRVE